MIVVHHDVRRLAKQLRAVEANLRPKVLYFTIKEATAFGKAESARVAKDEGGWKSVGSTRRAIRVRNPSRRNLTGVVQAYQRRPDMITRFNPSPRAIPSNVGRGVIAATPWARGRVFKKAFYLRSKFDGKVRPFHRVGKGKLKGVYGASVPREVEREIERSDRLMRSITNKLDQRFTHHIRLALAKDGPYSR